MGVQIAAACADRRSGLVTRRPSLSAASLIANRDDLRTNQGMVEAAGGEVYRQGRKSLWSSTPCRPLAQFSFAALPLVELKSHRLPYIATKRWQRKRHGSRPEQLRAQLLDRIQEFAKPCLPSGAEREQRTRSFGCGASVRRLLRCDDGPDALAFLARSVVLGIHEECDDEPRSGGRPCRS